jgi:hypothetical protein
LRVLEELSSAPPETSLSIIAIRIERKLLTVCLSEIVFPISKLQPKLFPSTILFVSVSDAALSHIVCADLNIDAISHENPDIVFAHFTTQVAQENLSGWFTAVNGFHFEVRIR